MDDIEAKQLEDGKNMIDYHLLNGDAESARAVNASLPFPESERMLMDAKITKIEAVKIKQNEIMDRLASGEDPRAIKAELEAKNEDGTYTNHPGLSALARADLIDPINKALIAERDEKVKTVDDQIAAKDITTEAELEAALEGVDVDPTTVSLLKKKLKGERMNTQDEIIALQLQAANYDPTTDPDGVAHQSIKEKIDLVFGKPGRPPLLGADPRRDDVIDMLTRRRSGKPLTAGQAEQAQILRQIAEVNEIAGKWKIPASRIKKVKKDGSFIYVDTGAVVDKKDPDYVEVGADWNPFTRSISGRKITLSPDDEFAVDQGKEVMVEDEDTRHRELAKGAEISDKVRQGLETGVITDSVAARKVYDELVAPMMKDAAGNVIVAIPGGDRSNFPASRQATAPPDVEEKFKWLED
jgi:hypothetical protein